MNKIIKQIAKDKAKEKREAKRKPKCKNINKACTFNVCRCDYKINKPIKKGNKNIEEVIHREKVMNKKKEIDLKKLDNENVPLIWKDITVSEKIIKHPITKKYTIIERRELDNNNGTENIETYDLGIYKYYYPTTSASFLKKIEARMKVEGYPTKEDTNEYIASLKKDYSNPFPGYKPPKPINIKNKIFIIIAFFIIAVIGFVIINITLK